MFELITEWISEMSIAISSLGLVVSFLIKNFVKTKFGTYSVLIYIALIAVLCAGVYFKGQGDERTKWQSELIKTNEIVTELNLKNTTLSDQNKKLNETISTLIKEKERLINSKGKVIIKQVDRRISDEENRQCVIPDSFIEYHNEIVELK